MRSRPSYLHFLLIQLKDLIPLIFVALCISVVALINLMTNRPKSKPVVQKQEISWSVLKEFQPKKR